VNSENCSPYTVCGSPFTFTVMTWKQYGWSPAWESALLASGASGVPGRVVAQHRNGYRVVTTAGEVTARPSGRLLRDGGAADLPAVGDWVVLEAARIIAVLPRRTSFERRAAGTEHHGQIVAANIDHVWVVTTVGQGYNPRRLERYVALAWESGASPLVVLTKSDTITDPLAEVASARLVAPGVDVVIASAANGDGIEDLRARLRPGETIVLLGPSGVGKSTLVNTLAGREILATAAVGDDGRGRHTTTHRELVPLANGALLLDTPGMRELGLWAADTGLDLAFADIASLASACRYRDCHHQTEPGCAVLEAVSRGTLDAARLESWQKLQREAAWIASLADPLLARERRQSDRAGAKLAANRIRDKGR
jgi:ribosome biogenesis GTPase